MRHLLSLAMLLCGFVLPLGAEGTETRAGETSTLLVYFTSGQWLEYPISRQLSIEPDYRTVCIQDGSHKAYLYIDEIESLGFAIKSTPSSLPELIAGEGGEDKPWSICTVDGREVASGMGRPEMGVLELGKIYVVTIGTVSFKYTPAR